jgi:integrase
LHAAVDGRLRFKTARDYRTLLARYVRPRLGQVKLSRLKPLDLQSLLLSLTNRGLSARTVRYTHAVLRSALDQARRWKLLVENPAADMPLPRADKREFRVLTPEEAQRFISFCQEDPAGLVLLVALTTGLRRSEVSGDSRRRLRSAQVDAYDYADARTNQRGVAVCRD